MKRFFKFLSITTLSLLTLNSGIATGATIYTIGDSTMADYDPSVYPNQRGWGQMFKQFLMGDVTCQNAARNGRSSKSFYTEGLWTAVLNKVNPGDYVFIQFGHNDEKNDGASGDIGTTPAEYKTYLESYINETRAKGGIPVLLTPIVRCYFSGNEITAKGAHNLSTTGDDLNYPLAMKTVATDMGVTLIDHTALSKALVESYGPTNAKSLLYISDDSTHPNVLGATLFARLVVQDLVRQNILVSNLNASPDLILNPNSIDFGNCYQSTTATKSFTVSGMDLSPTDGSVTITATDGFSVGLSATGSFTNSIDIDYTGGNLTNTTVYVRYAPTTTGLHTGTVQVSTASGTPKDIDLTGNALSMTGGVEAIVHFPLTANANAIITGPVNSLGQSYSGMYQKNFATVGTSTGNMQRSTITGDSWPSGELDIVSNRYIQFAIQAQAGTTFTIDSIGAYAAIAGGNAIAYRVMGSTSENFATNAITFENKPSNTANAVVELSYKPILQVTGGETFYLRFYPWYISTSATGKYLCLQNLMIKGQVSSGTTNTNSPENDKLTLKNGTGKNNFIITGIENTGTVQIYNQMGIVVFTKELIEKTEEINISHLPKGFYIINAVIKNDKISKKIIIN